MKHLVFYDGTCGLCDHVVQFLLKVDKKELFAFAPLQGTTADEMLKGLPKEYREVDSLVLVENYQSKKSRYFVMGKGALRILWLLGGAWALLGWMAFLPCLLFDAIYRLVARNRHRIFSNETCFVPNEQTKHRFLP